MTAWLLIWAIGTAHGFAVPGMASKSACEDLAKRIGQSYSFTTPGHACVEYSVSR